jgi:hypothetical protein
MTRFEISATSSAVEDIKLLQVRVLGEPTDPAFCVLSVQGAVG